MSKEKKKGTEFETAVARYLNGEGVPANRAALHGAADEGDLEGVTFKGLPCVVECKNRKGMELSAWVDETERERGNAGAAYAFVVHKRRGRGEKAMGDTYVTMTLSTLARMVDAY